MYICFRILHFTLFVQAELSIFHQWYEMLDASFIPPPSLSPNQSPSHPTSGGEGLFFWGGGGEALLEFGLHQQAS